MTVAVTDNAQPSIGGHFLLHPDVVKYLRFSLNQFIASDLAMGNAPVHPAAEKEDELPPFGFVALPRPDCPPDTWCIRRGRMIGGVPAGLFQINLLFSLFREQKCDYCREPFDKHVNISTGEVLKSTCNISPASSPATSLPSIVYASGFLLMSHAPSVLDLVWLPTWLLMINIHTVIYGSESSGALPLDIAGIACINVGSLFASVQQTNVSAICTEGSSPWFPTARPAALLATAVCPNTLQRMVQTWLDEPAHAAVLDNVNIRTLCVPAAVSGAPQPPCNAMAVATMVTATLATRLGTQPSIVADKHIHPVFINDPRAHRLSATSATHHQRRAYFQPSLTRECFFVNWDCIVPLVDALCHEHVFTETQLQPFADIIQLRTKDTRRPLVLHWQRTQTSHGSFLNANLFFCLTRSTTHAKSMYVLFY